MRAFLLVLAVLSISAFAHAGSSIDEIRTLMSGGDFAGAQRKIDSDLAPSGGDRAERYQLLMLKGECRLQLKDRLGSASAFKSASKVAGSMPELAAARANALIVERSSAGLYTPRTAGGTALDIMNPDSRKQAMIALQSELWQKDKPQIDAALRATQLPPIEQVFNKVADIYCLEMFSQGDARNTEKVMRELGGRAYDLMQTEMTKLASRIEFLANTANSSSSNARGWDTGRMGLTSQQRDEVKAAVPYLVKIRDRATEYRNIAAKLGGNENKWDSLVADAVSTISDAESLYNDR